MAKFVALLEFSQDTDLLTRTRPDHRIYLQSLLDAGKLWMSGPWTDDTGAMLIYEVASESEARALLDADPYRKAGVVVEARIKEWRVVFQQSSERGAS